MTDEQRDHFDQQGYLIVPDALDDEMLGRLLEAGDRVDEEERQSRWCQDRNPETRLQFGRRGRSAAPGCNFIDLDVDPIIIDIDIGKRVVSSKIDPGAKILTCTIDSGYE
jgi:hypothetical protein